LHGFARFAWTFAREEQDRGQAQGHQHGVRRRRLRTQERENWNFFIALPEFDRRKTQGSHKLRQQQFMRHCSSSAAACAGLRRTPYVKMLSPAFWRPRRHRQRHRLLLDLRRPTCRPRPCHWTKNGRGPTWNNSLFEDAAEFGLGFRVFD